MALISSGPIDSPLLISLSTNGVIPFLSNSIWMWLRKVLRTSAPRKLGKTSCVQMSEEEGWGTVEGDKEEGESSSLLSSWWNLSFLKRVKSTIAEATVLVKNNRELCGGRNYKEGLYTLNRTLPLFHRLESWNHEQKKNVDPLLLFSLYLIPWYFHTHHYKNDK